MYIDHDEGSCYRGFDRGSNLRQHRLHERPQAVAKDDDRNPATFEVLLKAFCEPDYTVLSTVVPEVPLLRQCEEWQRETFRALGACVDMGMRLYHTFRDSGFVDMGMTVSQLSGYGARREMIDFFVEGVRSILPKIQQLRIATREEVNIDTLADRIEAQARAVDPQWVGIRYISAWARKP